MGILNSSSDLLAKMKANDEKTQNDLFSMSEDSTLAPVFRNMARRGLDYITALESEAEIRESRIATLERQLAEAQAALDRCNKTCEMTAECWRNDLAEAQELLKVARCPNSNCDNKGTVAIAHNGDYELQHCQWCHEAGHCCVEDSTPGREG